jgi:L-ribulose-5-phosphate 4-epimerase
MSSDWASTGVRSRLARKLGLPFASAQSRPSYRIGSPVRPGSIDWLARSCRMLHRRGGERYQGARVIFVELRRQAWEANQALRRAGLVMLTFGNASAIDRSDGVLAIKPSGIPADSLEVDDIVVVDLETGQVVEGRARPSSDTPTHLVIARAFPDATGIVHTHSPAASAWAQANRPIPCLGTTHADHFRGPVPVTRALTAGEIGGEYEAATGRVIVETFTDPGPSPTDVQAVLVAGHGPFIWGLDPEAAVANAIALELVAAMALDTVALAGSTSPIAEALLDRHYARKHGPRATYGQGPAA